MANCQFTEAITVAAASPALLGVFKKGPTTETDVAGTPAQHVDVIHPGLGAAVD